MKNEEKKRGNFIFETFREKFRFWGCRSPRNLFGCFAFVLVGRLAHQNETCLCVVLWGSSQTIASLSLSLLDLLIWVKIFLCGSIKRFGSHRPSSDSRFPFCFAISSPLPKTFFSFFPQRERESYPIRRFHKNLFSNVFGDVDFLAEKETGNCSTPKFRGSEFGSNFFFSKLTQNHKIVGQNQFL